MNDRHVEDLLTGLLQRSPEELLARLVTQEMPAGFNWLGLAEVASARALPVPPVEPEVSLPWARVAILAYEKLGSAADDRRELNRFVTSLMRLRAALIHRHGGRPGDPVLDCDEVFDWFLVRRAGQLDAAERDGAGWRDLPIERIRELRDVENELGVLALLDGCRRFGTPEVQGWLALRDRLP